MNRFKMAHCLVCYEPCGPVTWGDAEIEEIPRITPSKMDKDLEVIFLLKNLFEVPAGKLEEYLVQFGGRCPGEWGLKLCVRCKVAVDGTWSTWREMVRLSRQFVGRREQLVGLLRGSEQLRRMRLEEEPFRQWEEEEVMSRRIVEETRVFVCQNDYGTETNPFLEGDSQANRLWTEKLEAQRLEERRRFEVSQRFPQFGRGIEDLLQVQFSEEAPQDPHSIQESSNFNFFSLHLCKDPLGTKYQCPLCNVVLSHLAKLKFHVIRLHLDIALEAGKLAHVSTSQFQNCCKVLLEQLTEEERGANGEIRNICIHCSKLFTDKRYLQCHWIQHHYPIFIQKLQEFQIANGQNVDDHQNLSVQQEEIEEIYQCSQCTCSFKDVTELKVHALVKHPEEYFPRGQFNAGNVAKGTFHKYIVCLFRQEKYKTVGNASVRCSVPSCSKVFGKRSFVNLHMVEDHYDMMADKLRELINSTEVEGTLGYKYKLVECPDCHIMVSRHKLDNHRSKSCRQRRRWGLIGSQNDEGNEEGNLIDASSYLEGDGGELMEMEVMDEEQTEEGDIKVFYLKDVPSSSSSQSLGDKDPLQI